MGKNQNDQRSQQSEGKSNQPAAGKERENPQINPGNPLPNKPEINNPTKPDSDNDPTKIKPGINEPKKIDPTRIVEPPPDKPEPQEK